MALDGSEDRKARKLRFRHRALQHKSGNTHKLGTLQPSENCFQDDASSQYAGPAYLPTQGRDDKNIQIQLERTGYNQIDSFDDSQWRHMLEQLPGIHWQGEDPWYQALEKNKQTKKYCKVWRRVPIIRPQDQSRYAAYKMRERKDLDKNKNYVVWPAHVERAFEIACICIPPILGKKQVLLRQPDGKVKLSGRNELIAWKIHQLTGEWRLRKQISSHIQVIKKFLEADGDEFLDAVKTDLAKVEAADLKCVRFDDIEGKLVVGDPMTMSMPKMKRSSTNRPSPYPRAADTLPAAIVQGVSFRMLLQDSQDEVLHTCSTMQSEMGAQQRLLTESLKQNFPHLELCLTDGRSNACDVILFESSISLVRERPLPGAKLAIYYTIDFVSGHKQGYWRFRTTRYEHNGVLKSQRLSPEAEKSGLKIQDLGQSRFRLLEAPLMTDWWVEILTRAVDRRANLTEDGHMKLEEIGHGDCYCQICLSLKEDTQRAMHVEENDIRRELQEMSLMQEVFGENGEERLGIYLWRFREAQAGETPTTTWRRLKRDNVPKPEHPPPDPSLILSSSVVPEQDSYTASSNSNNITGVSNSFFNWDTDWQHENVGTYNPQQQFGEEDTSLAAHHLLQSESASTSEPWPLESHNLQMMSHSGILQGDSNFTQFQPLKEPDSIVENADEGANYQFVDYPNHECIYGRNCYQSSTSHQTVVPRERTTCHLDDFSFENVTDSNLSTDFHGGHIQIAMSQVTEPTDTVSYSTSEDATPQIISQPYEQNYSRSPQSQLDTPVLYAPQPRRLISTLPLLSPTGQNHAHHSRESSLNLSDSLAEGRYHSHSSYMPELCADGAVLAQLTSENPDLALHFQGNHIGASTVAAYPEHIQPPHILPSNDENLIAPNSNTRYNDQSEVELHRSIYELHSSLLISPHPQTQAGEAQALEQDTASLQSSIELIQPAAEPIKTDHALMPVDDTSWVCDIAIAQLEGWIEHANAMEADLVGAISQAPPAVVDGPAIAALERNDAAWDEANLTVGQGRVIGEVHDEVKVKEEMLGDDEGYVLLEGGQGVETRESEGETKEIEELV